MNTSSVSFENLKQILQIVTNEEKKNKLLSQDEVRELFIPAISRMTLYRWMKSGMLPFYKVGSRTYFKYRDVLNASMESGKKQRVNLCEEIRS